MSKFVFNDPPQKSPVRIEQVWAEKPGGGVVHITEDMPATTPVAAGADGTFEIPKQKIATLSTSAYTKGDVTIYCEPGHGIKVGDYVTTANGAIAVKVVGVTDDGINGNITLGTNDALASIPRGGFAYKAVPQPEKEQYWFENAKIDEIAPVYITGNDLKAEDGEYQPVRLINGANVRKETAIVTEEEASQMKGIHLV